MSESLPIGEAPLPALSPGETRSLSLGETEILLCNVNGELYAVENRCSHAALPLTGGRLRGCELECPVHSARFDVRTGKALSRPARRPLRSFRVERTERGIAIHEASPLPSSH